MDLDEQARTILRRNDKGGYTLPTHGLYPYQWNWDSAFAAWGFATFDLPRAWAELTTLFSGQWDTGMVPHIIFHQTDPGYFPGPDVWDAGQVPPTSGISQPPVAATMARLIFDTDPAASMDAVRALFPKMLAWHRWWMENRCRDGAICITHPWESGRDNCPDWDMAMANVDGSGVGEYTRRDTGHVDASMRPKKDEYDRYIAMVQFGRACGWDQKEIVENGPFLVADPGITFILTRANDDLAALAQALGEDTSEIAGWQASLRAGVLSMWNPEIGAHDARDMRTGQFAGNLSSAAFLVYLTGADTQSLDARLMRAWDAVPYGIPSADPEAPGFDARRYWRGPSWPFLNALIAWGLKDAGRTADAERLRLETAALIEAGGFHEYFDPTDATACGGKDFTWTAAIWLAWAGKSPQADMKGTV